ncbi:class I SAM-dependent methyltransferase [Rhodococcus marinonascens]|uniref:class I SAM-dependent methyltransferase n=1 Tax=Rhodococcus marinonascens TaxID=38311 RepID=UPI0009323772|nr:class I SAM-dependent methyltransferase [Rhodococcus marinonascens]
MGLGYKLAYRFKITPWVTAGPIFEDQIQALLDPLDAPPGKVLDIGCGTGYQAIAMAKRGWQVTGIDNVQLALDKARSKARKSGVDVRFVYADATDLEHAVGRGYHLILDVGCYHGLSDRDRVAYVENVTAVSEPHATLLMFAFGPGYRGPLPRGVSRSDVERTFEKWKLVSDVDADIIGLPRALEKVDPRWFRLVKN